MTKAYYKQKEVWLHKMLECIYEERGLKEIEDIFDIVEKHMPEEKELKGEILDYIYDNRKKRAQEYLEVEK
jgi:hypothetical protein